MFWRACWPSTRHRHRHRHPAPPRFPAFPVAAHAFWHSRPAPAPPHTCAAPIPRCGVMFWRAAGPPGTSTGTRRRPAFPVAAHAFWPSRPAPAPLHTCAAPIPRCGAMFWRACWPSTRHRHRHRHPAPPRFPAFPVAAHALRPSRPAPAPPHTCAAPIPRCGVMFWRAAGPPGTSTGTRRRPAFPVAAHAFWPSRPAPAPLHTCAAPIPRCGAMFWRACWPSTRHRHRHRHPAPPRFPAFPVAAHALRPSRPAPAPPHTCAAPIPRCGVMFWRAAGPPGTSTGTRRRPAFPVAAHAFWPSRPAPAPPHTCAAPIPRCGVMFWRAAGPPGTSTGTRRRPAFPVAAHAFWPSRPAPAPPHTCAAPISRCGARLLALPPCPGTTPRHPTQAQTHYSPLRRHVLEGVLALHQAPPPAPPPGAAPISRCRWPATLNKVVGPTTLIKGRGFESGRNTCWEPVIQTCKNTCKQPQSSQDEPGKAEGSRIRPAGGVEEVEAGRAATAGSPSRATQNLSPLEDGSNLRRVQLRHWR